MTQSAHAETRAALAVLSQLRALGMTLPLGYWLTAEILSVGGERLKLVTPVVERSLLAPVSAPLVPAHGSLSAVVCESSPRAEIEQIGLTVAKKLGYF